MRSWFVNVFDIGLLDIGLLDIGRLRSGICRVISRWMSSSVQRIRRFVLLDAAWLTKDRVLAFSRVLLIFGLGLTVSIPWTMPGMRVGSDFSAFWTAAGLALNGRAADVYGDAARQAMAAVLGPGAYAPFFYPPTALLMWVPFAFLPFAVAAVVWVGGTAAAYAVAVRLVLRTRSYAPALAFPAVLIAGLYGQNSMLSAALFGGAAATLGRYPVFAGMLIGSLAYKPQLAVLAPLALAVAGRWRAFVAAAVTAGAFMAASVAAFGVGVWAAFIAVLPEANAWNATGVPGFDKFASPYAAIRLLGGSATAAWLVQGVCAALAISALVVVVWRRPGAAAEIAMLVMATAFCVPFLGLYDIVIFMVAGAWLVSDADRTGWYRYERMTLALLYVAPLAILVAATHGIPLAPLALAVLAVLVVRRACGERVS